MTEITKLREKIAVSNLPPPANDSRLLFERLRDYASRGLTQPETLSHDEIQQICFALSVCIADEKD